MPPSDSSLPAHSEAQHATQRVSAGTSHWYAVTMLLLVVHQIDAAYWQEWAMFGVPGGVQGFLVFNALAVGVLILGYREVLLGGRRAALSVAVCGGLGIVTAMLHLGFALFGREEFHLPLSIVVIVGCGIAGVVLACRLPRLVSAARP